VRCVLPRLQFSTKATVGSFNSRGKKTAFEDEDEPEHEHDSWRPRRGLRLSRDFELRSRSNSDIPQVTISGDPLVAHFMREHLRKKQAWFFAGVCQVWIWLNSLSALAFRFWVIDRFNYTTFVEEKFWPGLFFLESLVQLGLTIIVCLGLLTIPRDRKFWGFVAATIFSVLVNGIIAAAWAMVIVPEEYRLAATFALFGGYLTIPAIGFAVYCSLVTPSRVSVWIYAVTLTIALKCAAIILIEVPSLAFISYTAIVLIAVVSVVLPFRFGLAKPDPRISEVSGSEAARDDEAA
jgi:hypothetical protein